MSLYPGCKNVKYLYFQLKGRNGVVLYPLFWIMYLGIPNCLPPVHPINMNQNICFQMVSVNTLVDTCSCAICLKPFEKTSKCKKYVKKLECGHIFHSTCIDTWFTKRTNCPYCRKEYQLHDYDTDDRILIETDVQRNLYEDFFRDMPLAQRRRILYRPNPEELGHTDRQIVSYLDLYE